MTNEELAILIKSGKKEYYAPLWQQTQKFFFMKSNRFYLSNKERMKKQGVELDDLIQTSFFALVTAVEAYKPESGYKLLTYASYHVANEFRSIMGQRTKKRDVLNDCISLDGPVGEDGETSFSDAVPDAQAAEAFSEVDRKATLEAAQVALNSAIDKLSENEAKVIRCRFYDGYGQKETADHLGITAADVRKFEAKGLQHLRKPGNRKTLLSFADELVGELAYRHIGLTSFEQLGASSVEWAFEVAERRAENGH